MGGTPISALAIVCFPEKGDTEVLGQILAGGLSKMMEAKCTVVGAHSVLAPQITFAYAVTGTTHPKKVLTNAAPHPPAPPLLTHPLPPAVTPPALPNGHPKP